MVVIIMCILAIGPRYMHACVDFVTYIVTILLMQVLQLCMVLVSVYSFLFL